MVGSYLAVCLLSIGIIVLRGDGPHPNVARVYPFNGDRYWPGGTAQITFTQAMDQSSVERALQVSPGAQGQGAWFGNILNLQPVGDWRPNVTYHVSLIGKVTDDQGRPLQTPYSFTFRVHHIGRLRFCRVHGVRNVCERVGAGFRPLTDSTQPVLDYALSSDGSLLAYTHRDGSGPAHLFLIAVDGTGGIQLTHGTQFDDSRPAWSQGNSNSITYDRRPAMRAAGASTAPKLQIWNVDIDGSNNLRLG